MNDINKVPDLPDDVKDFLIREKKKEKQQEGDITVRSASVLWDCTLVTARTRLRELVADGKLVEYSGKLLSGVPGNFYRIVNDKQLDKKGGD